MSWFPFQTSSPLDFLLSVSLISILTAVNKEGPSWTGCEPPAMVLRPRPEMEATHTWRRPTIRNSPFWVTVSPYKTLSKLGPVRGGFRPAKYVRNPLEHAYKGGLDSAARNVGVAGLGFVFIWVFSRSSKFLLARILCRFWSQGPLPIRKL